MSSILLATVLAVAVPAAPPVGKPTKPCTPVPVMIANNDRAVLTQLGKLPDANQELAVNRTSGGCPVPMIVRYQVSR